MSLQRKAECAGQILIHFQTFALLTVCKTRSDHVPTTCKTLSFYGGSGFGGDVLAH